MKTAKYNIQNLLCNSRHQEIETILAENVHSGKWEVHEYAALGIVNFSNIYSSKHWEILDYVVVKRSS